jgi:hypothetical protein
MHRCDNKDQEHHRRYLQQLPRQNKCKPDLFSPTPPSVSTTIPVTVSTTFPVTIRAARQRTWRSPPRRPSTTWQRSRWWAGTPNANAIHWREPNDSLHLRRHAECTTRQCQFLQHHKIFCEPECVLHMWIRHQGLAHECNVPQEETGTPRRVHALELHGV